MSELGRRLGDWWVGQQSVWRCGMADWGEAGDENEDVDRSLLMKNGIFLSAFIVIIYDVALSHIDHVCLYIPASPVSMPVPSPGFCP
jgi:hypothetical protein